LLIRPRVENRRPLVEDRKKNGCNDASGIDDLGLVIEQMRNRGTVQ